MSAGSSDMEKKMMLLTGQVDELRYEAFRHKNDELVEDDFYYSLFVKRFTFLTFINCSCIRYTFLFSYKIS